MASGGKWKDALLKTSLPLELLVAEQLMDAGFYPGGEFEYSRPSTGGDRTEFSVDLVAHNYVPTLDKGAWASLSFLVECKYNYPGVRWLFAPNPSTSIPDLGFVDVVQDMSMFRVPLGVMNDPAQKWIYCLKGVELHEDNVNPQSISRGLHQLRFAMVQLHAGALRNQLRAPSDAQSFIEVLCPILLTTAPLWVLRPGLTLREYQNAESLDDLAEEVSALVASQRPGPDLLSYIEVVYQELLADFPNLGNRVAEQAQIFADCGADWLTMPDLRMMKLRFRDACERVLVINHQAFPDVIRQITDCVARAGATRRQHGSLLWNSQTGESVLERVQDSDAAVP
jgi:hypothetical protein